MAKHRRQRHGGGRKRKDGPRSPSGRLSRAYLSVARDEGTAELQRHKLGLVNGTAAPELSASLSGILFAHGVIDDRQRDAADRFSRCRAAVFGVVMPDRELGGRMPTEEEIQKREKRYERLVAKLSVEQKLAIVDLALDLRPNWARRAVLGLPSVDGGDAERRDLVAALDVLADRL